MSQTPNLKITEIAANQNQKEVTANQAFIEFDGAITDLLSVAMTDANYTLNSSEGGEALAHMAFTFSGTLSADRNIIVPVNKKLYLVQNNTTGGHNLTVKTSGGTGVAIAVSATSYTIVYCDGTNVVVASSAGGSGTVTHSGGLTSHAVIIGNGSADVKALGSLGSTTTVLHGNASGDPSFGAVVEGDLGLTDITTANASTTKHGLLKKLPNDATMFMNGIGNWAVPAGGGGGGGGSSQFAQTIGDGASTAYTVTHSLGTEDVIVEIHDISSGEMEIVDVDIVDDNSVTVTFGSAPSSDSKRVVIVAGTALFLSQLGDVLITSPSDGQVLKYNASAGKWENQTESGSGGIPAGQNVVLINNAGTTRLQDLSSGWANYTMFLKMPCGGLLSLPANWKFSLLFGSHAVIIEEIAILKTAIDDLNVISSVAVTFGASSSPTIPMGVETFSDNIALQLDTDHDWWICYHITSDSGNSSAHLFGLGNISSSQCVGGGYISGDHTGDSPIPSLSNQSAFSRVRAS